MIDNWDVWNFWLLISTQWRTSFGGLIGLDYTAVTKVAEIEDVEITPCFLEKIKALENTTLTYFAKQGGESKDGEQ